MKVFTIGHSNVTFDEFVGRAMAQGIQKIVDVRSAPYSKYTPHFSYDYIERNLPAKGIEYIYMGDRLGGRPRNDAFRKPDGTPDYDKLSEADFFVEGLKILTEMLGQSKVCLLCAEEDPANCHRSRLVAKALAPFGVEVVHILGDGSLEPDTETAKRRLTAEDKQLKLFC